MQGQGIHPLNIDVTSPAEVARWRPLVNWILVIPHFVWLALLGIAAAVVVIASWFSIVFTGKMPDTWGDFVMGVQRYQWRVIAYLYAWTDVYPSFSPAAGYVDPGDYPAVLYCARPEERNRLTVALRIFWLIPQVIVLYFINIAAEVVLLVAWFAVLFTGRWPEGMRNFAIGAMRWQHRVGAYGALLTDVYPPFAMGV